MSNRLAGETSPYLLQHAENPVDWYPWGDEALARAKAEQKPILLSIGYSACHWCHVMEHESFEDASIASLMNELFVNVKVDREERPDLDQIYQLAVQVLGRSGGWPLTVFLTPERKPFFAGTYFPNVPRYGMPAFPEVLRAIADAWGKQRDDLESTATELTAEIERVTSARARPEDVPRDVVPRAAKKLAREFDDVHGGFGERPKFPNTLALDVMLRAASDGDAESLARVEKALAAMRAGGIWDQLGGGLHRYSTDERWLVPHFEKMLYDNALLLRTASETWRASKSPAASEIARGIVAWLEREMLAPSGAFHATQDADSEGEEGRFFVWTPEQLDAALTPEESALAKLCWGVAPGGNFETTGASVLHETRPLGLAAQRLDLTEERARELLESARAKLFAVREKRPRPNRDDKIVASWNGLMIGALAQAGSAFGEPRFTALATGALEVARTKLWDGERLLRVLPTSDARIDGFLDDHGDLAGAAIDVAEATGDGAALAFAKQLVDAAIDRFWDEEASAFAYAPRGSSDLIVRTRDAYDHAVPSGTSSIVHALLRLASHVGEERYERLAERVLRGHVAMALQAPMGFGHLIGAMDRYARGATEIVVVGAANDARTEALLDVARRAWVPRRVLARLDPEDTTESGLAARLGGKRTVSGAPAAYVCRERACSLPITEPAALVEELTR